MGLRFRRSIRIAPGLRLNVGMKSVSVSAGAHGISYTVGSAGQRASVGLPGTGLYWTHVWRNGILRPSGFRPYLIVTGFVVLIALAIGVSMLLSH
jgi:hypothetical protein